jgi:hypothetical protein
MSEPKETEERLARENEARTIASAIDGKKHAPAIAEDESVAEAVARRIRGV